jgi:ubiquinone/menaquinone biosynthesis C-methylase UbiE
MKEKSTQRKDLFNKNNKIATEYDLLKMAIPHHDEFQQQTGKELLNNFDSHAEINILEIGAGTGLTTQEISRVMPNAKITSIDLEKVMLDQAKAKNLDSDIVFVQVDVNDFLNYANQNGIKYDAVVTGYTLHNFSHTFRSEVLAGICGILKDGGIFINADKIAHDDKDKYMKVYKDQIEKYNVYDSIGYSDLKQEWVDHYQVDNQKEIILIEGVHKKELKKLGFKDIQTTYREMLETVVVYKK